VGFQTTDCSEDESQSSLVALITEKSQQCSTAATTVEGGESHCSYRVVELLQSQLQRPSLVPASIQAYEGAHRSFNVSHKR
jgi:hypothetical protein